jgi:hypothetical protein
MTTSQQNWEPHECSISEIAQMADNPLGALAKGDIPAIIIRGAYSEEHCRQLVARFYDNGLVDGLPKPGETIPDKPAFERVDIGTSLAKMGDRPDKFFESAQKTRELYDTLFSGMDNPVELLYDTLSALSDGKTAVTAREPDGRQYGPAIIRCHMPHFGYRPHIDSVRQREKRTGFSVHQFDHQLAGILCLQPPERRAGDSDSILYHHGWSDEVDRLLQTEWEKGKAITKREFDRAAFNDYIGDHDIETCKVSLSAGDMYFFNTELLHEVPAFGGHRPRIVEATFIGYSSGNPEIFVWS